MNVDDMEPSVFPAEHMPTTPPSTRRPSHIYDDPAPDGFQPSIWPTQHFDAFDNGSPFAQRYGEKEEKEQQQQQQQQQQQEEDEEEDEVEEEEGWEDKEEEKGWEDKEEDLAYGGDDEEDEEDEVEDGMVRIDGVCLVFVLSSSNIFLRLNYGGDYKKWKSV